MSFFAPVPEYGTTAHARESLIELIQVLLIECKENLNWK